MDSQLVTQHAQTFTRVNTAKATQYVYLVQLREFVVSGEATYKVGRTLKDMQTLIYKYPAQSIIKMFIEIDDSSLIETMIVSRFHELFSHRPEHGNKYFNGDVHYMIEEMMLIAISVNRSKKMYNDFSSIREYVKEISDKPDSDENSDSL